MHAAVIPAAPSRSSHQTLLMLESGHDQEAHRAIVKGLPSIPHKSKCRKNGIMIMQPGITILGRALPALLSLFAALAKSFGRQPFLSGMAAFNVPGILLPAVIALDVGAALVLLFGVKMRYAAGALAAVCILMAVISHFDLVNVAKRNLFLKDIAIASALMMIAAASRRPNSSSRGD